MSEPVQARVNPDGFVAQRFDADFNGRGHWLLMHIVDEVGLTATVLTDEEVQDWVVLAAAPPTPSAPGVAELLEEAQRKQEEARGWVSWMRCDEIVRDLAPEGGQS